MNHRHPSQPVPPASITPSIHGSHGNHVVKVKVHRPQNPCTHMEATRPIAQVSSASVTTVAQGK